jgi:hypothetical protein
MDTITDSHIFESNYGVAFHCAPFNGSVHGIASSPYAALKLFFDDGTDPDRWVRYITADEARAIQTMFSLFLQLHEVSPLRLSLAQIREESAPPARPKVKFSEPVGRHGSSLGRERANGRILRVIAESDIPLSVHEISRRTGLPQSTVGAAVLYLYRTERIQRDADHDSQGAPYLYTLA